VDILNVKKIYQVSMHFDVVVCDSNQTVNHWTWNLVHSKKL